MMTPERFDTRDDAGLAALPVRDARPERVEEIRSRCLGALATARQKRSPRREQIREWRGSTEAALATGLGALFLAATVERVLEILR